MENMGISKLPDQVDNTFARDQRQCMLHACIAVPLQVSVLSVSNRLLSQKQTSGTNESNSLVNNQTTVNT
jgi:hypothetical protein